MNLGEGKIEIPLDEFWTIVDKYHDHKTCELAYGVPKINKENHCIEINYAYGYESHPSDWVERPECLKEWDNLNK